MSTKERIDELPSEAYLFIEMLVLHVKLARRGKCAQLQLHCRLSRGYRMRST